jgi:secretion/DNA translocation related TadE-like protein
VSREQDQRGAVTGLTLAVAAFLVVVTLGLVAGGRVLVAQREAAAAADLTALAAAVAAQRQQEPCRAAERLARQFEVRVSHCRIDGDHARLTVVKELGLVLGRTVSVSARAHSGPR